MNNIDEYAEWASTKWTSRGAKDQLDIRDLFVMTSGFNGEWAEAIEAIEEVQKQQFMVLQTSKHIGAATEVLKKSVRDGTIDMKKFKKEMGDVLYYWSMLCHMHGVKPSEILAMNVGKVEDRHSRGVLHGNGDDR